MRAPMKVFRGVPIRRRIATPYVTAGKAEAQVDPKTACLQALFTPQSSRCDVTDLIQMCTFGHTFSPVGLRGLAIAEDDLPENLPFREPFMCPRRIAQRERPGNRHP